MQTTNNEHDDENSYQSSMTPLHTSLEDIMQYTNECIKIISISPTIHIETLLNHLNTIVHPNQVLGYSIQEIYTVKHLFVRFNDRSSVVTILSRGVLLFETFKLMIKPVVKLKQRKQDKRTYVNRFPIDRIQNLFQSSKDLEIIRNWTLKLSSRRISEQCNEFRNVLYEKLGLQSDGTECDISNLHRISYISSLLLLEVHPFLNSEYLSNQYVQYVSQLELYRVPSSKIPFVTHNIDKFDFVNLEQLNNLIQDYFKDHNPEIHYQIRNIVIDKINSLCGKSEIFKHYSVHIYGSSATDFGRVGSDFDVTIIPPPSTSDQTTLVEVEVLAQFRELLDPEEIPDQYINTGLKSVLKFIVGDLNIDLSIEHSLGIANTRFLQSYSELDSRVKFLVLIIKNWAKSRGLNQNNGGYISSYAFCILCIYYLQQIHVLPNLQELMNHPEVTTSDIANCDTVIYGFDCSYVSNLELVRKLWSPAKGTTELSLGHLLLGFFQFYSNFNFQTLSISIRQSNTMVRDTPVTINSEGFSDSISIEDPFELRDLGKFAVKDRVHRIQKLFRETNLNLLSNNFIDLFEYVDTADVSPVEQEVEQSQVEQTISGQLIVSDIDGTVRIVSGNHSVLIENIESTNRTLHGDMVSGRKLIGTPYGQVLKQIGLKEKVQLITGCINGGDLLSLDPRFPDPGIPVGGVYGLGKIVQKNSCSLFMSTKRLYPWNDSKKNFRAIQHQLFGCKMDIHAHIRSVIHANFTNNYGDQKQELQELEHSDIVLINSGILDLAVGVTLTDEQLTLYLPDSMVYNDAAKDITDHNSKIVISIPLDKPTDVSIYSSSIPDSNFKQYPEDNEVMIRIMNTLDTINVSLH
jgi:DNA polymerase sigma